MLDSFSFHHKIHLNTVIYRYLKNSAMARLLHGDHLEAALPLAPYGFIILEPQPVSPPGPSCFMLSLKWIFEQDIQNMYIVLSHIKNI